METRRQKRNNTTRPKIEYWDEYIAVDNGLFQAMPEIDFEFPFIKEDHPLSDVICERSMWKQLEDPQPYRPLTAADLLALSQDLSRPTPGERNITFMTGAEGMRNLQEAMQEYLEEERARNEATWAAARVDSNTVGRTGVPIIFGTGGETNERDYSRMFDALPDFITNNRGYFTPSELVPPPSQEPVPFNFETATELEIIEYYNSLEE